MSGIKLKDMTERELLIQQARDVQLLCRSFDDFKDNNREEHKDITDKIASITEKKVSNKLFFSAMGALILFIMALTGYVGITKNGVVKNSAQITGIEKSIDYFHRRSIGK